ncbi:DRD2B protein, partial [Polypterus senegalus]
MSIVVESVLCALWQENKVNSRTFTWCLESWTGVQGSESAPYRSQWRSRQDTLASFAEDLNKIFLWITNPEKTTESGITTASPKPEKNESKMGKKKVKQSDNASGSAVGAMADAWEELRSGLTSPEKPPGSNDPSKEAAHHPEDLEMDMISSSSPPEKIKHKQVTVNHQLAMPATSNQCVGSTLPSPSDSPVKAEKNGHTKEIPKIAKAFEIQSMPNGKTRTSIKTLSKRKLSQQKEKKATQMLAIVLAVSVLCKQPSERDTEGQEADGEIPEPSQVDTSSTRASMSREESPPLENDDKKLHASVKAEMVVFQSNGKCGRCLEQVYQYLMTVLPTSVEAERAFSVAGALCTKVRSHLDDRTLDTLCFLRSYYRN